MLGFIDCFFVIKGFLMKRLLLVLVFCLVAPSQAEFDAWRVARILSETVFGAAIGFLLAAKAAEALKSTEKFEELLALAESGDAVAQYRLAYSYEYGNVWEAEESLSIDPEIAFYWYECSANQGYICAERALAFCYFNSYGCEKDYKKSFEWSLKAAAQGSTRAEKLLGILLFDGMGCEQNYEQAAYWLKKAADKNSSEANHYLGWMYQNGLGVPVDCKQAARFYKKASYAADFFSTSQNNLGYLYMYGLGVRESGDKAIFWYKVGAKNGSAYAMCSLGHAYYLGNCGLVVNYENAFYWFDLASQGGNAESNYYLGQMYEKGIGLSQDLKKAIEYYAKGAALGCSCCEAELKKRQ